MKENYSFERLIKDLTLVVIGGIVAVILTFTIINECSNNHIDGPNIEPIEHSNDSLQQVINDLDSIKNGKIEETINLNDSATVQLFNELTSK